MYYHILSWLMDIHSVEMWRMVSNYGLFCFYFFHTFNLTIQPLHRENKVLVIFISLLTSYLNNYKLWADVELFLNYNTVDCTTLPLSTNNDFILVYQGFLNGGHVRMRKWSNDPMIQHEAQRCFWLEIYSYVFFHINEVMDLTVKK